MAYKGTKMSEEFREKMRQIRLENPIKFWLGKKFSDEHKNKLREAKEGKKLSRTHIENIRKAKKGMKPSMETRRKMSDAHRGDKAYNWKGGQKSYRHQTWSLQYKEWRTKVFERDNHTCQMCGVKGHYITAHHIKSWTFYPKLQYEITNGQTLCESCHSLTDNYRGRGRK